MDEKLKIAQEILYWQRGGGTSFICHLFNLFCKADPYNRLRISIGFPKEAYVWTEWYDAPSPEAFYESYGLTNKEPA